MMTLEQCALQVLRVARYVQADEAKVEIAKIILEYASQHYATGFEDGLIGYENRRL